MCGHCIGVDPYYLTYKAQSLGYNPQVILAGRRINDSMGKSVAEAVVKGVVQAGRNLPGARIGLLGLTFKENVPDLRNTKVVDVIRELEEYGVEVLTHDAMADPAEAVEEYGLSLSPMGAFTGLDALIVAVGHSAYTDKDPASLPRLFADPASGLILDIRGVLDKQRVAAAGLDYWRL